MRYRNSVFHDVLKLVPWAAFDKLVDQYGNRRGVAQLHLAPAPDRALSRLASKGPQTLLDWLANPLTLLKTTCANGYILSSKNG